MFEPIFSNNAVTTLASAVAETDTTIILSDAGLFPTPEPGRYFLATLQSLRTDVLEIIKVTGRVGNTLTVERAQEGTTAKAFLPGDDCSNRLTAGVINALGQTAYDAAAETIKVQDWARVSRAWAETYPGPLPPDILAIMGILGTYYSSKWWAYFAADLVQSKQLVRGQETRLRYIMDGASFFVEGVDQTGQVLVVQWNQDSAQVFVNGVLAAQDVDYFRITDNRITFPELLPADTIVEVFVVRPFAGGVESVLELRRKVDTTRWNVDGTTARFLLIDTTGTILTPGEAIDVMVSVDGVWQRADVDYVLQGSFIEFFAPPRADAKVFATAMIDPPGGGAGLAQNPIWYSDTPPPTPVNGQLWINYTGEAFVFDRTGDYFVQLGAGGF